MFDGDDLNDAFEGRKKEGLQALPDAKYEFEIKAAEIVEKNGVVKLHREAVVAAGEHDGHKVEWDLWLKGKDGVQKDNVARLGDDLQKFGFDVDEWTRENQRPFFGELKKACAAMVGMKFRGTKKANEGKDGKVFQNLYLDCRLADGKLNKYGADELDAALKESVPF